MRSRIREKRFHALCWSPGWWWFVAAPLGIGIAATPGLAGHAFVGTFTPIAVPADTIHVIAMSVWLGGLATLALIVFDRDPDAARSARRFSPVALTSVILIVATGLFAYGVFCLIRARYRDV